MKKIGTLLLLVLMVTAYGQAQTEVGNATLPNSVTFNDENLVINGAGLREKFWIDIYAAGLYLKNKSEDASAIAAADETMAIKLHILSGMMSRSKMVAAFKVGFEKSTNNNTAPFDERIAQYVDLLKDEIAIDQIYDLVYVKGKGNVVYKDGVEKGVVEGLDFKEALFNIWIGNKPADAGLRDEMLGDM